MKIVIFGLTVSSSWGNGHATLWRGLCSAFARRGHEVVFFEHDLPFYAAARDLRRLPGDGRLILYSDWSDIASAARCHLSDADVGMVTSYCPDGIAASDLVLDSPARCRVFYDLDTPVTLASLRVGDPVPYLPLRGLADFDLALSFTGGDSLHQLRQILGARRAEPLYGSADPEAHCPVEPCGRYAADLSYLGTWAADRDPVLRTLFLNAAARLPHAKFLIGGSKYENGFPWAPNVYFVNHVPPSEHPAFYCSSRLTLNVTRSAMARVGYCPSGRLFEAACCGAPLLTDYWPGLETFFEPGSEILTVSTTDEVLAAFERSDAELRRIADAARERTLAHHTAAARVLEFEKIVASAGVQEAVA
ncbi:MAG TPA: glycosyltransferase [Bryobacteraceae bacterium]|nr:glycosyltransferase [Bryobacteraceae bacterium]